MVVGALPARRVRQALLSWSSTRSGRGVAVTEANGNRGSGADMVTLLDVVAAARRIAPYIHRTPLERSAHLSDAFDAEIWLKLECFQATGSFKVRGALNALLSLDEVARRRGVL